ncbi:hypothetical protein QYE76_048968 [Lolium multiflorum]|uniref:EF-hand domain-containing protein n=1 Tax=Lolium multiflorum TaxID=4521 RepID=A0AAD8SNE3_LOLMU|nr:hypothetical protein QYE76_048968 [Lolium multiflorum]
MSTTDGQKQMQKPQAAPAALSAAGHDDAETKKLFSRFDADGDGRISPSELAAVAGAISPPPSESAGGREVGAMMDELDSDRNGYVDLGEFTAFHAPGGRDLDAELRDAFDVYDINGDGRISVAELSKVLGRIGEGCSTEECERMIASVGVDGEGFVGFQEFKKMMSPDAAGAQAQPQPAAGVTDDKPKTAE